MLAQLDRLAIKMRPGRSLSRLVSYTFFEGRPLTTKGRWFNKVVFCWLKFLNFLPSVGRVTDPLFIVGTGRSGTTILGQVLGLHKHIGFLNEPKALWHMIIPDEDIIGNYTSRSAKYRLNSDDVTHGMIDRARRLYGWCKVCSFCKRVLDKYPELVFRIPFVLELFPDAKFILLVRNGWDTCSSIDSWSKRNVQTETGETHDWWGRDSRKWRLLVDEVAAADEKLKSHTNQLRNLTDHRLMAVVEWVLSMNEGLRWMDEWPDRILMLHYEELIREPGSAINKILDFSAVARDSVVIDYAKEILAPAPTKPNFEIPDYLRSYFDDVMLRLGYRVQP